MENDECHINASDNICYNLKNNPEYYEADISYEYSPFEESLKSYCDSYINIVDGKDFFNSLVNIVQIIAEYDYEDVFRPVELITYYLGKIIFLNDDLRDVVYNWLAGFCRDFKKDWIVEEYFKPFINGKMIFHADEYYTDYDDFNEMISVFKVGR